MTQLVVYIEISVSFFATLYTTGFNVEPTIENGKTTGAKHVKETEYNLGQFETLGQERNARGSRWRQEGAMTLTD